MTAAPSSLRNLDHKRGRLRRHRGIAGLVDGPTVAAHIQACLDAGWTRTGIASTSHVSVRAIRYILNGQPTVQHDNASRLLAVRPECSPNVPSIGSIRRIRALSRAGYTIEWTAQRAGCSHRHIYEILNGTVGFVDRALAARIAEIYRRHEATPGPSNPARVLAKNKDWPGPEAWDVDTIDDPRAEPNLGNQRLNVRERAALRREEIIHLAWCGHDAEQIVDRLNGEISISTARAVIYEWRTGQKRDRRQVAA